MIIIVIEGLSLTGKTTLCKSLLKYYKDAGKKCRFCPHGHLTTNEDAISYYKQAISAYNSWQLQNAIDYSFKSLQVDYSDFLLNSKQNQNIDIVFLDRHFTSQYVVAEYFNNFHKVDFSRPKYYFEFLLTSSYSELLRRSIARNDNHSKLTDFTLSNSCIHEKFETLYKKYILLHNPLEYIIQNDDFSAIKTIIPMINQLI